MRIAFFDSGIGGISVLHEAMKQLPQEDFVYYADTLHVPYGSKKKEDVQRFILESVADLMDNDVKALVVACNTATSIAIAELRKRYAIPIVGMEPAVKPAVEMSRLSGSRVLVTATPLTLKESKYNTLIREIDDASIVDSLPLPELVQYCEELELDGSRIERYFAGKLAPFELERYGTVVLGCTHYPYYKRVLSRLLPAGIRIIDGSSGTVRQLSKLLAANGLLSEAGASDVVFACSNRDEVYIAKMKRALQLYAELEKTAGREETGA